MRLPARSLVASLFVAVLVVGAAGCGDNDEPEATGSEDTTATTSGGPTDSDYGRTTGDGGDAPDHAIVAKDFELSDLTVGPGEEIVLQNDDGTAHTATADDDAFDLRADGGATSDPGTAPDEPGEHAFHCEIHPSMTGTLTVEG